MADQQYNKGSLPRSKFKDLGDGSFAEYIALEPGSINSGGTVAVSNFPASQPVTGTFWQAVQPVSGTVSVNNFPATQPISGSVSISNFPASQAVTGPLTDTQLRATPLSVSGTFWQATQPISGSVSVSNFPATQPVSGTVNVGNFPASQAVTGTFWQATQPVSLATNTPDVTDRAARLLGHVTVDNASLAVTGTFWQATQPISGTVTANQGGAPWAENITQIAGSAISLGQKAMSASLPTVIASDQGTLPVTATPSGGTNVLKTGTLVTSAVTADQVVLTYTVTAAKTFYLRYLIMYGRLTTLSATATVLGAISLETPSGTKVITLDDISPTTSELEFNPIIFPEPIPISAGTVVRVVVTPAATTSMTWRANFGGYEK